MSKIELRWHDEEKRILRYTFPAFWEWEDFADVKRRADALLDESPYPVVLVMDTRPTQRVPLSTLAMTRHFLLARHPNGRPILILTENTLIRSLFHTLRRITGRVTEDVMLVRDEREIVTALETWQQGRPSQRSDF